MSSDLSRVNATARQAVAAQDWHRVNACALEIARLSPNNPDAPFLMGLTQKAARRPEAAAGYFRKALSMGDSRFDAAIELANINVQLNQYDDAHAILNDYRERAVQSAHYTNLAGQAYFAMGLYQDACVLYEQAVDLQPDAEKFQADLAACAVYVGRIDSARKIYRDLLKRRPRHQRNHYELAQLGRARNDRHIKQMLKVLKKSDAKPANNIYLYYALGKEYEDLGHWDEAFRYIKKAGDAVKTVADHDVADDVRLIDKIIEVCSAKWLNNRSARKKSEKTPIFVVGLPRTGTTLTDRILSSHSKIRSIGESQLLQMVLRNGERAGNQIGITEALIENAAERDAKLIADEYLKAISHRLGDEPYFVEKLPENVLYLGFIAKAWPDARIVHLRRHPMDACFATYKQSFFRFAYSLEDLAEYYLAYERLTRHWREVLGHRVVELQYEELVADHEGQTRRLLDGLDFEFEDSCLQFDQNTAPVATASSVQVREGVHTRSVGKWKHFEHHLQPLRALLEQGGVIV